MNPDAAQPEPPAPSLSAGAQVGPYRIEAWVATGGMGEVYEATQLPLGRTVALKILRVERARSDRAVRRFAREAEAMSRLYHPNTVSILEYDKAEDDRPYIVMEYIDGILLSHLLSAGRLEPDLAVSVASQVASALADAHANGVVHRDVKPDNILITFPDGEQAPFVKVLDFGIAHELGADAEKLTAPGHICGTTEYMSPEQARGEELDGRSDVYALGVVLFEMLEGRLPFVADTPIKQALAHQLAPIPTMQAPISEALGRCIYRAMAKEPRERPADAEAFRQELLRAVAPPTRRAATDWLSPARAALVVAVITLIAAGAWGAVSAIGG